MLSLLTLSISIKIDSASYKEVQLRAYEKIEIEGKSLIFIPFTYKNWNGVASLENGTKIALNSTNVFDFGSEKGKITIQAQENVLFQYSVVSKDYFGAKPGTNILVSTFLNIAPLEDFTIVTSPYGCFSPSTCYYLGDDGTIKIGKNAFSKLLISKGETLDHMEVLVKDSRLNHFDLSYEYSSVPHAEKSVFTIQNKVEITGNKYLPQNSLLGIKISFDSDCDIKADKGVIVYVEEKGLFYGNYSSKDAQLFYVNKNCHFIYNGKNHKPVTASIFLFSKSLTYVNVIDSSGTFDMSFGGCFLVPIYGSYSIKGIPESSYIATNGEFKSGSFTAPALIIFSQAAPEVIIKTQNSHGFTSFLNYADLYSENSHGLIGYRFNVNGKLAIPKGCIVTLSKIEFIAVKDESNVTVKDGNRITTEYQNRVPSVYRVGSEISIYSRSHNVNVITFTSSSTKTPAYFGFGNDYHFSIGPENRGFDWVSSTKSSYYFSSFDGSISVIKKDSSSKSPSVEQSLLREL